MTCTLSCQDLSTAHTSTMAEKHMGMHLYTNSYIEQKVYTSNHSSEYPKGNTKPSNVQRGLIVTKPQMVFYPSRVTVTYPWHLQDQWNLLINILKYITSRYSFTVEKHAVSMIYHTTQCGQLLPKISLFWQNKVTREPGYITSTEIANHSNELLMSIILPSNQGSNRPQNHKQAYGMNLGAGGQEVWYNNFCVR